MYYTTRLTYTTRHGFGGVGYHLPERPHHLRSGPRWVTPRVAASIWNRSGPQDLMARLPSSIEPVYSFWGHYPPTALRSRPRTCRRRAEGNADDERQRQGCRSQCCRGLEHRSLLRTTDWVDVSHLRCLSKVSHRRPADFVVVRTIRARAFEDRWAFAAASIPTLSCR